MKDVCASMATCALAMTQMLDQNQKVQKQLLQSIKGKKDEIDVDEADQSESEEDAMAQQALWHEDVPVLSIAL